jgi:hypothetical protein
MNGTVSAVAIQHIVKRGEVIPVHTIEGIGGVEAKLHPFLTSALDGVNSQIHAPNCFMHRKET